MRRIRNGTHRQIHSNGQGRDHQQKADRRSSENNNGIVAKQAAPVFSCRRTSTAGTHIGMHANEQNRIPVGDALITYKLFRIREGRLYHLFVDTKRELRHVPDPVQSITFQVTSNQTRR